MVTTQIHSMDNEDDLTFSGYSSHETDIVDYEEGTGSNKIVSNGVAWNQFIVRVVFNPSNFDMSGYDLLKIWVKPYSANYNFLEIYETYYYGHRFVWGASYRSQLTANTWKEVTLDLSAPDTVYGDPEYSSMNGISLINNQNSATNLTDRYDDLRLISSETGSGVGIAYNKKLELLL